MTHHATVHRIPGSRVTEVAKPLRGWGWTQWRAERACRKATNHCWHPEGMVDWFCCMCAAETDGMPPSRCVHCAGDAPMVGTFGEQSAPEPQQCQGADFSKLARHLGENLEEHTRRDGMSPVRAAIFLSRGRHAPGEHCPSAPPPEAVHASYCSWLLGEDCDCAAEQPEGSDR